MVEIYIKIYSNEEFELFLWYRFAWIITLIYSNRTTGRNISDNFSTVLFFLLLQVFCIQGQSAEGLTYLEVSEGGDGDLGHEPGVARVASQRPQRGLSGRRDAQGSQQHAQGADGRSEHVEPEAQAERSVGRRRR